MNQEELSRTIRHRQYWALAGLLTTSAAAVYASKGANGDTAAFIYVTFGLAIISWAVLLTVNIINFPRPKTYYRTFNKVVYIYMAKALAVLDFIHAVKSLLRFRSVGDIAELGAAGAYAAEGTILYRASRKAKLVEEYYAQSTTTGQALSVPTDNAPAAQEAEVIKLHYVPVILLGLLSPTALMAGFILAFIMSFAAGGSTFLLYSVLLGFGSIIGPIALLAPYLLIIGGFSWLVAKLLRAWNVSEPFQAAFLMLLGAGAVDSLALSANSSFLVTEVVVSFGGILCALITLFISEMPYGSTKKWLRYVTLGLFVALTLLGLYLFIHSHK